MKKIIVTAPRHAKIDRGERFEDGTIQIFASSELGEISVSDGYHTMDELYDHRITLFIALAKTLRALKLGLDPAHNPATVAGIPDVWRSREHADGSSFEGEYIMGIGKHPGRQITYHIPLERWEETEFAETLDRAPEFDGHKPSDVLDRLKNL